MSVYIFGQRTFGIGRLRPISSDAEGSLKLLRMLVLLAVASLALALPFFSTAAEALPRKAAFGVVLAPAQPRAGAEAGVLIQDVLPSQTAARLGVRSGDVIVSINGKLTPSGRDFLRVSAVLTSGQAVRVDIIRGGKRVGLRGQALGKPLESYRGGIVKYGAVPFQGGWLRDIYVKPTSVVNPPVVFFIQGITCATVEPSSAEHPYRRLAQALIDAGIAFYRVEKPGVGDSIGTPDCGEIAFSDELNAFRAAYVNLTEQIEIPSDRIFIFGHSLGGMQAPMLASETAPRGVAVYGTVFRNWADYHFDIVRLQRFLMFDMDPAETAAFAERLRVPLHKFYHERRTPDELVAEYPERSEDIAALLNWDGDHTTMGRHYGYLQDLAQLSMPAAWQGARTNVLSVYGESDLIAHIEDDHRTLVEIVNHYRPGTALHISIPETDHGMRQVGERHQVRAAARASGVVPAGEFNSEVSEVLIRWIRQSMAAPPVNNQFPAQ
jgi:pimeloyl-ACP methyl ester carboxylesterase